MVVRMAYLKQRLLASVLLLAAALALCVPAVAQEKEPDLPALVQIELTEAHIKGYLGAAKKLTELFERIEKAGSEVDPKLQEELEAVAQKNGFKTFDELETVVSNITFVMSGFDEDSNTYVEPVEALKQELAEIKADKELKSDEKEQLVQSIQESIKFTPKIKHPANVELVKKHFKALTALFK